MAEVLENKEKVEAKEQVTNQELVNPMIENYKQMSIDAVSQGNNDMAAYYKSKVEELSGDIDNEFTKEYYEAKKAYLQQEKMEYWENKRQKVEQEKAAHQDNMRQYKLENGAPRYSGAYKYESEWKEAAANEIVKNGESAYYKYCLEEAAKCRVKEDLKGI